ncbi:MAG TPA: late competence development ComFB family protein [Spirochaetota bacterium]|jgi:competence protein ComFB|nr:late competence development ComFB family protein [Spirochaetota bacterium]HOK03157.1 late competence development ComFB family protein [Spirochaetota bacterium]HOK93397.1 late competence development ComFB family protein [Spirochaetota bacterium]HOV08330.1 late competence development ComFB family protein [Spirochaetota bacterium]HPP95993.1 late competence development ComFB family protein [Spirochaetota bacterium]
MALFNLLESIVDDIVTEVLSRDESMGQLHIHKNDIMAYVLNRVPPRYITGERGIIHTMIDPRLKFQQHTDILFLTYEAIEIFSKRRHSDAIQREDLTERSFELLPHVMGEVLEETTLSIIPDLKITLLYRDNPAHMTDSGWKNPYIGTKATRGYFHFWPKYIEDEMPASNIEFKIKFEHPKFEDKIVKITVDKSDSHQSLKTVRVPLVLLKLKAGVDPVFLREE